MHSVIGRRGVVAVAVVLAAVDEQGGDELVSPVGMPHFGLVPIGLQDVHQAVDAGFGYLLALDEHRQDAAFGTSVRRRIELGAARGRPLEDDPEALGAVVPAARLYLHLDRVLHLLVGKLEGALLRLIIGAGQGGVVLCAVLARHLAGAPASPHHHQRHLVIDEFFDDLDFVLREGDDAGQIVVDDDDCGGRLLPEHRQAPGDVVSLN
mmetsp:Transcript_44870/g.136062  ORF Transcript_44870/g.136062 Transcript_44870/m.136062 type:complete len:208 (+) Transcript_44870:708-1331(+)